ncbi:MAG: Fe-S cluster assembly ATPase SufC [Candidatus Nanosyncoccus sp.]
MGEMLNVKKITVLVGEGEKSKKIIENLSLKIARGETVVILGPNGAGKSTLGSAIMGDPKLKITEGKISFLNKDITQKKVDERGMLGMMMTMQNPVEIPGISTTNVIRAALNARGEDLSLDKIRERISIVCKKLKTNIFFSEREINYQFSGGEKKKNEILQALVLKPKLLILDEIDSGLDVDAANNISELLSELQKENKTAFLIITHNMRILKNLKIDKVCILKSGKIVKTGGVDLLKKVEEEGFGKIS